MPVSGSHYRNYVGEFDNFAATMTVSTDLLCSFELLKVGGFAVFERCLCQADTESCLQPLDHAAMKKEMAKNRRRLSSGLQAPIVV